MLERVFPINKKLWTSSYVLYTIRLDLLILSLLLYLIELRGMRRETYFFEVFGKNTLFIYLLSETAVVILWRIQVGGQTACAWLYDQFLCGMGDAYVSSLLFALSFMLACWGVGA